MYTSAFRRLARVTQVVPADEGHVFHNRLTHSIQVAQVGRRIAEKIANDRAAIGQPVSDIDPDVVEAACLAHDLGHPPFGHIAEKELNRLATARGVTDGFEGNAQSFRIVTKLAAGRIPDESEKKSNLSLGGLNLTRATLNALLKYPWLRDQHPKTKDKWGAYNSERDEFEWARQLADSSGEHRFDKSAEAFLMDLADDITYSVHDLDDFYRAGLIPLDRLRMNGNERKRFYDGVSKRRAGKFPEGMDESFLFGAFEKFIETMSSIDKPYEGTRRDRRMMRDFTAAMIGDFVRSVFVEKNVNGRTWLTMIKERRADIFMLKELTWHYVIKAPTLTTQQHGQTNIVRTLFAIFYRAAKEGKAKNLDVFPVGVREQLNLPEVSSDRNEIIRTIIDFIVSLTEEQAVGAYHRLTGISLGSALLYRWR